MTYYRHTIPFIDLFYYSRNTRSKYDMLVRKNIDYPFLDSCVVSYRETTTKFTLEEFEDLVYQRMAWVAENCDTETSFCTPKVDHIGFLQMCPDEFSAYTSSCWNDGIIHITETDWGSSGLESLSIRHYKVPTTIIFANNEDELAYRLKFK